ncbi:MAG: AAA family ATPase, partial [bacterium]
MLTYNIRHTAFVIDKTEYIYELIRNGGYIFLSRPRRFGKSLLLSTIEYLFQSEKELFKGLYIYEKWNWNEKYPVVKIDLSVDMNSVESLYEVIYNELKSNYKKYKIKYEKGVKHVGILLKNLIVNIYERNNNKQVVVLIDEYDKPIVDLIIDRKEAEKARNILKELYSSLKGIDRYLKFVLITGVSKFSKVSLF